jgi:hypothetical protein
MQPESDSQGIISFAPVLNWGVFIVQDETVGLAFDYYANAADAAVEKMTRLQLHLDPGAAAQLARAIANNASAILQRPPPG